MMRAWTTRNVAALVRAGSSTAFHSSSSIVIHAHAIWSSRVFSTVLHAVAFKERWQVLVPHTAVPFTVVARVGVSHYVNHFFDGFCVALEQRAVHGNCPHHTDHGGPSVEAMVFAMSTLVGAQCQRRTYHGADRSIGQTAAVKQRQIRSPGARRSSRRFKAISLAAVHLGGARGTG